MNVIEFNLDWSTEIAFCFVDNTRTYQSSIRESMKNQADGTLANICNKRWKVYQWIDEDALLKHACDQGHKWAVVFSTGTEFINGTAFFDSVINLTKQKFFIAGHVLDRKDAYYELHHQCYIVNLRVYKMLNCPEVGKQELGVQHTQDVPWRSPENWHDDYTPKTISGGDQVKQYNHKCHGWNILKVAFEKDLPVLVFDESIRNNKKHFYPENPVDFYKHLGWAYHRLNYCQTTFVHTSNTETVHLPIKQYKQIVTPASGFWFRDFLAPDARVIMYDYNQASLDYWQTQHPEYTFVKCDLLADDNLLDSIDIRIPDTLVNISNIFNYEGTAFFYSLAYRKFKEKQLTDNLRNAMPTVEIYSSLSASITDIMPTWHYS
jgi:hypothetical protein